MSQALLILKINTTFEDVYVVLKLFFDISTSFKFSKDQCECTLHSEAPPCLIAQDIAIIDVALILPFSGLHLKILELANT